MGHSPKRELEQPAAKVRGTVRALARGASAERSRQRHPAARHAQRRRRRPRARRRAARDSRGARRRGRSALQARAHGHRAVLLRGPDAQGDQGVLNVSESRVSQIHAQAVIHLRQKLRVLRGDLGYRENDPTIKQKYVRRSSTVTRQRGRPLTQRRFRSAREAPLFSLSSPTTRLGERSSRRRRRALYRGWLSPQRADALLADRFARGRLAAGAAQDVRPLRRRPARTGLVRRGSRATVHPELDAVRRALEALTGARFSHVLLNRYRNGNDSVAWHHDREVDHLQRPVIASLTLGATRAFDLRPKSERSKIVSIDLDHGDLLVMRGDTQTNWEHRVAKNPRIAGERINLTFRQQPD
jgi:hypothetical protein